jgi:hypothetical protein
MEHELEPMGAKPASARRTWKRGALRCSVAASAGGRMCGGCPVTSSCQHVLPPSPPIASYSCRGGWHSPRAGWCRGGGGGRGGAGGPGAATGTAGSLRGGLPGGQQAQQAQRTLPALVSHREGGDRWVRRAGWGPRVVAAVCAIDAPRQPAQRKCIVYMWKGILPLWICVDTKGLPPSTADIPATEALEPQIPAGVLEAAMDEIAAGAAGEEEQEQEVGGWTGGCMGGPSRQACCLCRCRCPCPCPWLLCSDHPA